jgi:3',5'-cyclic AMP phosphodiesterase CpdA
MRTIVHISDLHFGAADHTVAAVLRDQIRQIGPTVVAVSGDLTQRARRRQFAEAARFLRSVPHPAVVVPGNHDVPLYNLWSRFVNPLAGFHRHISSDRFPEFVDEEVAVFGADTTRSFTLQDGGLSSAAVAHLVARLDACHPAVVKVVVCHHPFDPILGRLGRFTRPAPDATAVATLVDHGADVFLTGHRHLSYAGHTPVRYRVHGRSAIVVEAGTATSTRARGEQNAFNVVRVTPAMVTVERLAWHPAERSFSTVHGEAFERGSDGWTPRLRDGVG